MLNYACLPKYIFTDGRQIDIALMSKLVHKCRF